MIPAPSGRGGILFRLLGFPVQIAPSAWLLLGVLMLTRLDAGPVALIDGIYFAAALGLSVLVHELGHAFSARALGLGPVSITLHGLGGLTRFSRPPSAARGALVTASGPAAGLALGGIALLIWQAGLAETVALESALLGPGLFGSPLEASLWYLIEVNLFWSLFNLVPVLPLDGGVLVLYGLTALVGGERAMQVTRVISLLGAAGIIAAGVAMEWWLLGLLGAWMGAQSLRR